MNNELELFEEYASKFRVNEIMRANGRMLICGGVKEVNCNICPYYNGREYLCNQITIETLAKFKNAYPEYFI